jgi:hypothetical protein
MKNDVEFLAENGIMDYSLLLMIEDTTKTDPSKSKWLKCKSSTIEEDFDILKPINGNEA